MSTLWGTRDMSRKTALTENGVWRVTGSRAYRGHQPGTEFPARLDRHAARRAIQRGDIELVDTLTPDLEPGSYRLPEGWPDR